VRRFARSACPRRRAHAPATKCINKTHGYESTLQGVDTSLARFGFGPSAFLSSAKIGRDGDARAPPDYIDLFLIHDPMSGAERRLATYRALLAARDAGKIRSVGVSN
jgi:aryl-alcohol dehydrogenase-like predicted oxidoreductase